MNSPLWRVHLKSTQFNFNWWSITFLWELIFNCGRMCLQWQQKLFKHDQPTDRANLQNVAELEEIFTDQQFWGRDCKLWKGVILNSVLLVGHLPGMYLTQWPVPGLYLAHSALSLWNVSGGKIKSKRGLILPHRVSARMTCKHSGPRCLCHWGSVRVVVLVVGEAVTNLPGRTELCRSARTRFHMHQHSDGQNKRKLKNKQTGSWSPPSSSW